MRSLPWRSTRDPYKIWLSEIILQQTRVAQGQPYYMKFIDRFPTVYDLAGASEEEVLKLWQGLGYYSRARNLHVTAKMVVNEYDGKFPNTYDGLIRLKGVGDYTASAIASICYGQAEAVVDGNVYRLLARYYGIDLAINSTKGIAYFKTLAKKVMDPDNIRDYNQGIMEFGAIQCIPKNPNCMVCTLADSCKAFETDTVDVLPVKIKKNRSRNRYFDYLVVLDPKNRTLLRKREGKDIWKNLWEFPLMESQKGLDQHEMKATYLKELPKVKFLEIYQFNEREIVHKLTHQNLYTKFWILKTQNELEEGIDFGDLGKFPVPVLIADFIKAFKI